MQPIVSARKYSDSLWLNDEGLSAPKAKSVKRKQRDKRKVGSDSDSRDNSGSDDDCHSYKPLTKRSSEDAVMESRDKLQRQESLLKEGILRKCSLLNALKQKYDQVQGYQHPRMHVFSNLTPFIADCVLTFVRLRCPLPRLWKARIV